MYLIYNRDYELVGEAKDFNQVKGIIGEDIREQDVDSLEFIRGKTVITDSSIKRLVHKIVTKEKSDVVDYITSEIEEQEDETVELKTTNKQLQNKVIDSNNYLRDVSERIQKAVNGVHDIVSGEGDLEEKARRKLAKEENKAKEETKIKEEEKDKIENEEEPVSTPINTEEAKEKPEEVKDFQDKEEIELDEDTKKILQHIERNHQGRPESTKKSASKVISGRRKKEVTDINFISIIEGKKVKHINDLKGKTLVKTEVLAQDVGLDREHIEFLMGNVLSKCGGSPKYQNTSVVSPTEAVWIIVSALTKRDGFGSNQRFQKTMENAEDFYHSWEQQKDEITLLLN